MDERTERLQGDASTAVGASREASRAELLPEEEAAGGSDDPMAQARVILAESDQRSEERDVTGAPDVEHRTSDETTEPA